MKQAITLEEAKSIWRHYNPEAYTHLMSSDREKQMYAALHWDGFKQALQVTGLLEVKK